MSELSPEELERIKREELKKIEELERENRVRQMRQAEEHKKGGETAGGHDAGPAHKDEGFDRVREEIRRREMVARGFVEYEGEWIPRDEAERRHNEKEERAREEEEKVGRAKQRKVDREKKEYEDYRTMNIVHIKGFSVASYVGAAMILVGAVLALTGIYVRALMTMFFTPGIALLVMGLLLFLIFFSFLIESETKLIEKSFFEMDGELFEFESEEEIGDFARRIARAIARKIHPSIVKERKPSEGDGEDGGEE